LITFVLPFFGVGLLLWLVIAVYYAYRGFDRIAGFSKCAMFVSLFLLLISIIQAMDIGIIFTRPDGIVVQWTTPFLNIFIYPILFMGTMILTYSHESEQVDKSHAAEANEKGDNKYANWGTIQMVVGEILVVTSFASSVLISLGFVLSWNILQWFVWAMGALLGILAFAIYYAYIVYFGIAWVNPREAAKERSGFAAKRHIKTFLQGTRKFWSALIAWVLLILSWITWVIIAALGHAYTQIISYNNEILSYLVVYCVLIVSLALWTVASFYTQHKSKMNKS